jgi:hypothetical protein
MSNQFHGYPPTDGGQTPPRQTGAPNGQTPPRHNDGSTPPSPPPPSQSASQKAPPRLPFPANTLLIGCSILLGILFSVCFFSVHANLSLLVFTVCASLLFVVVTIRLHIAKYKRAFFLIVPIILLSLPSVIFGYTGFTFLNIILLHLLFAAMLLLCKDRADIFSASFLGNLFLTIIPDFSLLFFRKHKISLPKPPGKIIGKIILGILVTVIPLSIIISILSSADPMFRQVFSTFWNAFARIFSFQFVGNILFAVGASLYFWVYIQSAVAHPKKTKLTRIYHHPDGVIASTVLLLFNLVFAIFCLVQFITLFSSDVSSYESYARNGFYQLFFVTLVNFSLVLGFSRYMRGMEKTTLLKLLLSLLCVFTGIMALSAFMRLSQYVIYAGFTPFRMFVLTLLAGEILLTLLSIIFVNMGEKTLLRAYVPILLSVLLVSNFTASEAFSTYCNWKRYEQTNQLEYGYLNTVTAQSEYFLKQMYESVEEPTLKREIFSTLNRIDSRSPRSYHWQSDTLLSYLTRTR